MPKIGEVDQRYVSYNVETVEVTGGRFWKPYTKEVEDLLAQPPQQSAGSQMAGMDPALFQYRSPIDLTNPKLRKLAAALGPSYMRVSGTWRNFTYFQNDDLPAAQKPPQGYNGIMTRAQWKGVVDFANAVDAELVTSVAISAGTRDANGLWTPDNTKAWFDYTKSIGGRIAATEFMNEPTFPGPGGAPTGYNSVSFARDAAVFRKFLKQESPATVFLGPGGVAEGVPLGPSGMIPQNITSEEILKATGPVFDAFSYHFYGAVSKRCAASLGPEAGIKPENALTQEWFHKNLTVEEFYSKLRNQYLPGKDLWLTETGEAACGGDKFAGQFVDSFRYTDQLGTLAQKSVKAVMQNTLASSDYGLLDEQTLNPRPNYWVALLWKRFMGTRVLDPGVPKTEAVEVFAQCAKGKNGAVELVAMNTDKTAAHSLTIPAASERYTLTAPDLYGTSVMLNAKLLQPLADGSLPKIQGEKVNRGAVELKPLSISFFTIENANNSACASHATSN